MKFRVSFFASLYISLLCASVSYSAIATQISQPERWFEVEVILFEHISDKKIIKEQFPDQVSASNLPQYKKYFDLLTPYLEPDLTGIKQFIPLCNKHKKQSTLVESLPRIKTLFTDAIKIPELESSFKISGLTTENSSDTLTMDQYKERVLARQEELKNPLFSTQSICTIHQKDIAHLYVDEEQANIQFNTIDVKALPVKLNALGSHISNSPYLIAKDSLLLSDITQRLQWSKEFKPLLHFGWRQVAVTRNQAIPLKLFAGDNLNYKYVQALKKHQSAHGNTLLKEQTTQLTNTAQNKVEREKNQLVQKTNNHIQEKQYLSKIFTEIGSLDNTNINALITELEQQKFDDLITIEQPYLNEHKPLDKVKTPTKPLQTWFLDGFFKIHLDHYLYINADFNIFESSLVNNTAQDLGKASMKLINFSQNKRAITGEIHYFDHPYVGMLVQIRRFDPTKPKEEAVTQVVN